MWWISCTVLLPDLYLVSRCGGSAMAANTVLPSMSGKACRTVSRAMPEYDPALCPLMLMHPSRGWSASPLAALGCGNLFVPISGWLVSRCVNSLRHCMYPGWGGRLAVSWGDGAKLQQFGGSSEDLSLDLGFDLDS